jgi:hypothetical protein
MIAPPIVSVVHSDWQLWKIAVISSNGASFLAAGGAKK